MTRPTQVLETLWVSREVGPWHFWLKFSHFLRCWSSATSFIKCPAPTSIPAPSSLDHLHMCALWHFSCSAVWCSQTLLDSQLCKDRDYVFHSNLLFICSLTWRVRVCGSHFKNCRVSPGSPAASSVIWTPHKHFSETSALFPGTGSNLVSRSSLCYGPSKAGGRSTTMCSYKFGEM